MGKIVIVGANHAGTAAVNAILDSHPRDEVTILDENTNISFLGGDMALWIGKQILKPDGLFYQTANDFRAKGATIHLETHVESIDYDNKVVHAVESDGDFFGESYDKLILATGSLPVLPKFPGCNLENIQKVKLFQDAQAVTNKLDEVASRTLA